MSLPFLPDTQELLKHPSRGTVERKITPTQRGRVYWQGTSWFARFHDPNCQQTVASKQPIMVNGIEGNTLLVMPVNSAASKSNN